LDQRKREQEYFSAVPASFFSEDRLEQHKLPEKDFLGKDVTTFSPVFPLRLVYVVQPGPPFLPFAVRDS
jgi:hypothetical protein